jgi:hypothetical protein
MLNNLHPGINKDSQRTSALSISATNGVAVIQNNVLQLTGPSSAQYNLRSYTLGSLATAINGQSGFTATVSQPSSLAALVLLNGTYTSPITIPMFTSFLWQLLKPVSLALTDALGAENQALLETVLNTSDGKWLDAFGDLFGVYRQNGEPDQLYAVRVFDFSVGPRVNNLAIQKSLMDLGYNATVIDNGANAFDVRVTLPSSPPQGFVYSYAQLGSMVGLLQAAGTIANIILSGSLSDGVALSDSISSTLRPAAWTWDTVIYDQFSWGSD